MKPSLIIFSCVALLVPYALGAIVVDGDLAKYPEEFPEADSVSFSFSLPLTMSTDSATNQLTAATENTIFSSLLRAQRDESDSDSDSDSDDEDNDDGTYASYAYYDGYSDDDYFAAPGSSPDFSIGYSVGENGDYENELLHEATDSSMTSAQNAFMATPHSADYEEAVYEAFSAVRSNCQQDFEEMCAARPTLGLADVVFNLMNANIFSSIFAVPMSRRLLDATPLASLHPLLSDKMNTMAKQFAAFRGQFANRVAPSAYRHEASSSTSSVQGAADVLAIPSHQPHLLDTSSGGNTISQAPFVAGRRRPGSVIPVDGITSMRLNRGGEMRLQDNFLHFGAVSPATQAQLRGNLRQLKDFQGTRPCGHHKEHGYDHEDGKEDVMSEAPEPPRDDYLFSGEMLWGADGDACMYANFDMLSQECQQSIRDVYDLRAQYWHEEQGAHAHGILFLFILMAFVVFVAIKKRAYFRGLREKNLKIYNALQANPKLKAELEAASGVVFEAPKEGCNGRSCCFSFLKAFLRTIALIVVSVFFVHLAGFITMVATQNLVTVDEDGNGEYPNPLIPLFIFLVTLIGLFTMLFSVRSYLRRSCTSRQNEIASTGDQQVSSAPAFGFRMPAVFAWSNRSEANAPAGYAVLSNDSVHAGSGAREMVVMQPQSQPQPQQQAQTIVFTNFPSTATCVTPVNII
jgi:hypothetical protein